MVRWKPDHSGWRITVRSELFSSLEMSMWAGLISVSMSPFSSWVARWPSSVMTVQRMASRWAGPLFSKNGVFDPG